MADEVKRSALDGQCSVQHDPGDLIRVAVTHDGEAQGMVMTEWNARRLLAMLSVVLELPLSKAAQKEIKL